MNENFKGKTFVFTGSLASIGREKAIKEVVKRGGTCKGYIDKNTSYLVVGLEPLEHYLSGTKSTKILKAEEYIKKGHAIKIITDLEFLSILKESNIL